MFIGLVIYGRLTTLSGGYLYDRQLVTHLRQQGDRVEVISLPWQHYGRHLLHNLSPLLRHRLQNPRFDLLLQDELNHPSLFWLNRQLRGQLTCPIVSIVHHLRSSERRPAWQNWLYRQVEQRYLHTVDGFVFNSQTTRQVVEGLTPARPHVVAYPAGDRFALLPDAAQIVARAQEPGPLRLLFVGNLIPRKGLHRLLAALAHLPQADWRLTVVGNTAVDPAYTRAIQRQISRLRLTPNITLRGPLLSQPLATAFATSHLLVVPSSYEGFGIVYLEGMAFGLPAIAGSGGAAHEIISEGINGFLANDPARLAQHIHTLHQQRQRLAEMGLAAQQRYRAHPTWEQTTAHIRAFLQAISRETRTVNSNPQPSEARYVS